MNEAQTRADHIDPALKAAGWGVVEGSRVLHEHGITLGRLQGGVGALKRGTADIADYVLVYRNTPLAVVEAKAWDKPHTEGLAQAKRYAAKLALFAKNESCFIEEVSWFLGLEGKLDTALITIDVSEVLKALQKKGWYRGAAVLLAVLTGQAQTKTAAGPASA